MSKETVKAKSHPSIKHVGILAAALLFVIKGLRSGSVKAAPIMNMDPDAEEYGMTTLEEEIWAALKKCGIKEKK